MSTTGEKVFPKCRLKSIFKAPAVNIMFLRVEPTTSVTQET